MLGIDVKSSRELQAVILAVKQSEKDIQANIRKYTKAEMMPEWKKGLAEHAVTRLEHRVLVDTAVVTVSNQGVKLKSASKGRPLSGGLRPKVDYAGVEFGALRAVTTTYEATSRKGKRYTVHDRHTRNQLRRRNPEGYVVYPTAKDLIPRFASLWVQTVVRTLHEAFEAGKH